ncbi:MAG: gfo/Idh/MocA family oxidoreductase, partial [Candidatus Hydrogenedentota bacterium]
PNMRSEITGLKEKVESLPAPAPQIKDFAESVRTRNKFALNESNGHRSCTLINLGKIAVRLGRNLKFDPVAMRLIDDDGANRLIDQPMRGQWHV